LSVRNTLEETFYRIAASIPALSRFFAPALPPSPPEPASGRPLRLEIVSHCWQYSRLLNYQLSSLVLDAPQQVELCMTVFYSPEDSDTRRVLDFFAGQDVPRVTWNPRALERSRLLRRAIGRNLAARETSADWIVFTDCDVLFREGALDALGAELARRQDRLVFPREHRISELLTGDDPMLHAPEGFPVLEDIDPSRFFPEVRDRAVGGLQIVRGDVARAAGYCANIPLYQRPVPAWRKTYEDRTFRWLLGTRGTAIEVPGFYRIRHVSKGRKGAAHAASRPDAPAPPAPPSRSPDASREPA
jgi:hypothetical protein